jgi:Polyketide cyclase / dehydrase and lipid transport
MAKSFYSMVLDHSADEVWAFIRSFGDYAWAGVESETIIEDGKSGDLVGAVRRVQVGERLIRQQLLAHSDIDRSYTYAFLEPAQVRNYQATIRVVPVVETGEAFVQWSATFDCAEDAVERWTNTFTHDGFAVWLGSLRKVMKGAT